MKNEIRDTGYEKRNTGYGIRKDVSRITYHVSRFSGFTLVEILVVIGVMGIVIGVATTVFLSIMRGSSKAKVLQEVKQNGSYTLTVMERMIRNAQSISSCASDQIRIINPDGNWTNFHCCGTPSMIASESAGLAACGSNTRLTNQNVIVSSACSSFINCSQATGKPPVIPINFTLSQSGTGGRPEEAASAIFQTTVSLRNF